MLPEHHDFRNGAYGQDHQSATHIRALKPTSLLEAQIDDFPQPGGQRGQSAFRSMQKEPRSRQSTFASTALASNRMPTTREQRDAEALQAAQLSTTTSGGPRTSRVQVNGSRRQTQLPPSIMSNATGRPPRKSMGPGLNIATPQDAVYDPHSRSLVYDPIQPAARGSEKPAWPTSSRNRSTMTTMPSLENAPPTNSSSLKASPNNTTPPQSQGVQTFLDLPPPSASTHHDSGSSSAKQSPQLASTPTLSGRRQSTALGASGLGARTVSPTDVRRSRRMSISNKPPPLPTRSPSPELSPGGKPPPTPPLPLPQTSTTPVSLNEIPDLPDVPQRKNSGRSVDSRSSYNSTRPMSRPTSSSSQNRTSFTNFSSRSLTTKSARNAAPTTAQEAEIVPPVPAIPKAYESPSETVDKPFFSDLPAIANFGKNLTAASANRTSDEKFVTPDEGVNRSNDYFSRQQQNRRLTLGARVDSGRELPNLITNKPSIHQQQRLPPINLLPLSTPTTSKIASMSQRSIDNDHGKATPPPSFGPPKTPSTPMTASKATFPSYDFNHDFDLNLFSNFRSSTSYAAQKSETSTLNNEHSAESPSVVTPASPAPPSARHGPSPFGSFSLPRPYGEAQQSISRTNPEQSRDTSQHGRKSSRSLLRRPSTVSKQHKETTALPATNSSDVEAAHSATSLRRKLSKGWRRSTSKASHTHVDEDHQTQKPEMPPPKLPINSTSTSRLRKSPKPPSSAVSSQTDLTSTINGSRSANTSHTELPRYSGKTSSAGGGHLQTGSKSTNSLFSPMSRMLGTRSSSHNVKMQKSTSGLDKDDQVAEDEMRKLGSKKREFEASARELDELQRRAMAKERVTPNQATRMASLNIFEKGEIIDYQEEGVFFCGTKDAKKFVGDLASNNSNFGFDDDRGDYNIVVGDHLAYRYEVIDILGKGSFGQVVRCVDHKTGVLVAVKIIRNKKRFHQQALVEVNILQKLREWDPENAHSMVNFTQSFYFRGHLCIATELLGINLYEFIKAHDFTGFSLKLIRRFTKQMLSSLCLLQEKNVIHCDLKPENILLAHPLRSEIKIIDFGSSCFEKEKVYTYIQSRFYRSPEVILGMNYGIPIDMWSLGCILAELYTGFPIFPGENEQEQLACIMEVFGPPEKHLIEKSSRKKLFFDSMGKPRMSVSSKGKRRRPSSKTLDQVLKCTDEAFLDFLARCLRWDPERRLKPQEAMTHEFITGKKMTRTRAPPGASTASPAKRSNTVQTPAKTRTTADAPITSFKSGLPAGSRNSSTSPVKSSMPAARRKSTMYDQQSTSGTRMASGSALPRATAGQRNTSAKPDLASAAAAMSLAGQNRSRVTSNGALQ
ncbi:MAG: hypothetical protein Q9162_002923 [Coniocarpon cinnabarinum]